MGSFQEFSSSPVKASTIIGTDVVNSKGENLGDIKEVVIDPSSGKVAYVSRPGRLYGRLLKSSGWDSYHCFMA